MPVPRSESVEKICQQNDKLKSELLMVIGHMDTQLDRFKQRRADRIEHDVLQRKAIAGTKEERVNANRMK